jgi:hypothetical protein
MDQALGDDGEPPMQLTVWPLDNAAIAHPRTLREPDPPAHAAAILIGQAL